MDVLVAEAGGLRGRILQDIRTGGSYDADVQNLHNHRKSLPWFLMGCYDPALSLNFFRWIFRGTSDAGGSRQIDLGTGSLQIRRFHGGAIAATHVFWMTVTNNFIKRQGMVESKL